MNRLKLSLFLLSYSFISHLIAATEVKGVDSEKWVAMNECPKELVEKFRYHISSLDNVGEWVKKVEGPYLCFKDLEMDQYRIGYITEKRASEECTSTWFVHSDFDREKNNFELGAWSFGATEQKNDCPMKRDYRMK